MFVVLGTHNMKPGKYIYITKFSFQRQQQSRLVQVQLLLAQSSTSQKQTMDF